MVAPQLPMVIQGQSTFYVGTIGPGQYQTIKTYISSALYCNTNQALEVDSSYNNIIGVRVEQPQVLGISTTGPYACPSAPGSSTAGANGAAIGVPGTDHWCAACWTTAPRYCATTLWTGYCATTHRSLCHRCCHPHTAYRVSGDETPI